MDWFRLIVLLAAAATAPTSQPTQHSWCPPFGLERVGHCPDCDFEADASADNEPRVNPVDLGTVLVPADWLLFGPEQHAIVRIAAIDRKHDSTLRVNVWFRSQPLESVATPLPLSRGQRQEISTRVPAPPSSGDRDTLHVAITDAAGRELWGKQITVMIVRSPPTHPTFGATTLKLRYDAPISVRDANTGELSSLPYEKGWAETLQDVVVWLPNGSRFVFWRGSSYVPFWASSQNTGLSYEWAETGPLPEGFVDSVEPLMDKELRYGRVEIVESTPARVHVRWTYQSTDFLYKVWGDVAQEDFYFYPDGFGTRFLTLKTGLNADYELSEFIILTSQGTYPLSVLPQDLVRILWSDGYREKITFPSTGPSDRLMREARKVPPIYRVRLHKDEARTAIYFTPNDLRLPIVFNAFKDQGQIVTPCYWGSHWPLARGKSTGYAIDDRIRVTPAHNSVMSFVRQRPEPLSTATQPSVDALGRSRVMQIQTWAWLIGLTDEADEVLLERAASFTGPPSLTLQGGRLATDSYIPQRRAIRIILDADRITLTLELQSPCVDPVFEFIDPLRRHLARVTLAGAALDPQQYAWDGETLWLHSTLRERTSIVLEFVIP